MSLKKEFEEAFSEKNLKRLYESHVVLSGAMGIDNLSQKQFRAMQTDQLEIVSRKVLSGTYKFTKYKLKLISKGRGKAPREISIPTIRDRIALRALCDFLIGQFGEEVGFVLPQKVVSEIKDIHASNKFDGFIKLDIANFYPSVPHNEFKKLIKSRIPDKNIRSLIHLAVQTPTVSRSSPSDRWMKLGIPQGLSISNILAALFLCGIDTKVQKQRGIKFFRYVDDVLILCKHDEASDIAADVIGYFNKLGLLVYDPVKVPEKSRIGKLEECFDYLGYQFEDSLVTVRFGSVSKLRESLVSIFTGYKYSKHKSIAFLEWRLNLRITGCIFENKCKGWLFFFSEINDEALLHQLDHYIEKLSKRFGVAIQPKKFVRAFYQIKHCKYESAYVPNFDDYSISEMKGVLTKYFGKSVSSLDDNEVKYEFKKRIDKQVKDLLTDVQDFGY